MIAFRQVSKQFGSSPILDRLCLEVPSGQRLSILGPSGSGKTTILRLAAGLERLEAGEIWLDDRLASQPDWMMSPHQRGIGMVFQAPALFPHMTAEQNILFACAGQSRSERQANLRFLLERLGIDGRARQYPHQLSDGEARRISIARALASRPKILLLDEPLTNLNLELKKVVMDTLMEHLETYQATVLYVTHDLEEARQISDQVLEVTPQALK